MGILHSEQRIHSPGREAIGTIEAAQIQQARDLCQPDGRLWKSFVVESGRTLEDALEHQLPAIQAAQGLIELVAENRDDLLRPKGNMMTEFTVDLHRGMPPDINPGTLHFDRGRELTPDTHAGSVVLGPNKTVWVEGEVVETTHRKLFGPDKTSLVASANSDEQRSVEVDGMLEVNRLTPDRAHYRDADFIPDQASYDETDRLFAFVMAKPVYNGL